MRQETVGLFGVSLDILQPVTIFHYHDERRRLRNFVDANTTWILAMENVVNCWIFCTFAGAVTTVCGLTFAFNVLWFAEIFVPLLVQLQPCRISTHRRWRCALLKFLYLCWCSYNLVEFWHIRCYVVLCWNFCTFAGAVTTILLSVPAESRCDLLKFLYLCWCSYNLIAGKIIPN